MMTYYYIWNKMRALKGEIYVLEAKARDLTINKDQADRLIGLDLEHEHLEKIESIWNKYGERAFDGYELKQEFFDEYNKAKEAS